MKTINLFLSVLLIAFTSCKNDEANVVYDFSVLGLEQFIINDETFVLDPGGFPSGAKENDNVLIVGYTNGSSTNEYDLVAVSKDKNAPVINVKSKYADVSVEITQEESEQQIYHVTVSRDGFEEKVVYNLSFINV